MTTALDFDAAYRAHQGRLLDTAAAILNDRHEAEDAVADAWLRAWQQRADWTNRGAGPLPWLTTLTKYAALGIIRDRTYHADITTHDEWQPVDTTPYPGLASPETAAAWSEVWPRLSERQAVAVWCRHIGGYTVDETARVLGVPAKAAQNTADEGLRRIAAYFRRGRAPYDCRRCGWPRRSIGHITTCCASKRSKRCEQTQQLTD
ncbi:MAG TPA: RNA polymerase sigma factor [Rugosimonospora sp.]|nr:RNA polymerase sigma factor [Rugosimonospora sp.]